MLFSVLALPFLMSFTCSNREVKNTTTVTTPGGKITSKTEVTKPAKPKFEYPYDRDNRNGSQWMLPETFTVETPNGTYRIKLPGVKPGGRSKGKIIIWDPLIMQVPSDWTLANVGYATPAGSGIATVSPGPVPAMYTDGLAGPYVSDYYVAEPGYSLYLVDIPEAHKVGGVAKLTFEVEALPAARRIDNIKFMPTFTMTEDATGLSVYVAYDGDWPTDFALLVDPVFIMAHDLATEKCSEGGYSPRFDQDLVSTWEIGTSANVNMAGMNPGLPLSVLFGGFTYSFPGVPVGGLGCVAQVSPDASWGLPVSAFGESSITFAIPNDPSFVGLNLNYQAVQLTASSDFLLGSALQVTIQ